MSDPTKRGKYMGRHVCTVEDPYDPDKHGTHAAHPDAVTVGGSWDGDCDDFRCPHCGTKWRTCYDDD